MYRGCVLRSQTRWPGMTAFPAVSSGFQGHRCPRAGASCAVTPSVPLRRPSTSGFKTLSGAFPGPPGAASQAPSRRCVSRGPRGCACAPAAFSSSGAQATCPVRGCFVWSPPPPRSECCRRWRQAGATVSAFGRCHREAAPGGVSSAADASPSEAFPTFFSDDRLALGSRSLSRAGGPSAPPAPLSWVHPLC